MKNSKEVYRNEWKYLISTSEKEILKLRMKPFLKLDPHAGKQGYMIRSLYFDDYWNSAYEEKEAGILMRKKYRIRIYDGSDTVIKLEKKSKLRGMTSKISAGISKDDCVAYMQGQTVGFKKNGTDLEKEFYAQIKMNGMQPVCIVEYERTAFVDPRGNVRITFDRNISGSENLVEFLGKTLVLTPLLPKGQHVLEVKYDELLPEHIAEVLELGSLQRTAFSKYYYARNCKNL